MVACRVLTVGACVHLDHHQLSIILDVLGTPSLDDFYAITSQRSREYIRALPFRKKKPFSQLFPEANPLVSGRAYDRAQGKLTLRQLEWWG